MNNPKKTGTRAEVLRRRQTEMGSSATALVCVDHPTNCAAFVRHAMQIRIVH
jgi:hypothetical protein